MAAYYKVVYRAALVCCQVCLLYFLCKYQEAGSLNSSIVYLMALSQSVEAQSTSQTSDTWSLGGRLSTRLHNGLERLGLYGHNSTSSSRPLLCPNLTLYFTPEVGGITRTSQASD